MSQLLCLQQSNSCFPKHGKFTVVTASSEGVWGFGEWGDRLHSCSGYSISLHAIVTMIYFQLSSIKISWIHKICPLLPAPTPYKCKSLSLCILLWLLCLKKWWQPAFPSLCISGTTAHNQYQWPPSEKSLWLPKESEICLGVYLAMYRALSYVNGECVHTLMVRDIICVLSSNPVKISICLLMHWILIASLAQKEARRAD